jgi:glyoxylase-like metal-dependent hydrolase (beta-lactamase superfamily II)
MDIYSCALLKVSCVFIGLEINVSQFESVGNGITRIDAQYVKPGVACFYLLESGDEYAVIETGTRHSFALLQELLSQREISAEQIRYVIPTHVHLDHAGGAGVMMEAFPEATLLVHPRGARHMIDPGKLEAAARGIYGDSAFDQMYGTLLPVDESRVREMNDGETASLAGRSLLFRHTRGHAKHHFCVWDDTSRGWFTGDMFGVSYPWFRFAKGDFLLPSTTPSQFEPQQYLLSLELLAEADPVQMYLTHFGAVEWSRKRSDLLATQVRAYAELAKQTPDEELEQALEACSLAHLRHYAPDEDEATLRDMLSLDMPLNAMGLRVWRDSAQAS